MAGSGSEGFHHFMFAGGSGHEFTHFNGRLSRSLIKFIDLNEVIENGGLSFVSVVWRKEAAEFWVQFPTKVAMCKHSINTLTTLLFINFFANHFLF